MNEYAPGNVATCYFTFLNRPLTQTEDATFRTPGTLGTLPNGAGVDPANVYFDFQVPGQEEPTTYQYPTNVTKIAVGSYSAQIEVTADPGEYKWRGRGTNSDGTPAAASFWQRFSSSSE